MSSIEIKGMKEALAKLDRATSDAVIHRILTGGSRHLMGKIKPYAPSSEANQPRSWTSKGRNSWYQRGYGSKWVRKNNSIAGRQSSEQLEQNWSIRVEKYQARVGNNASYGPYVQGKEQASFHKARGWKTTDQVVDEEREPIVQFAKREVDRELSK
jgi:hypothetical protein